MDHFTACALGVLRLCLFWSDMQPRFQEIALHLEETLVTRLGQDDAVNAPPQI